MRRIAFGSAVISLALLASGGPATAETIFGLTTDNRIFSFDSASPGTIGPLTPVTGLAPGTTLVGIDFRPATPFTLVGVGQLPGGGGNVYTINAVTGAATSINAIPALTGTAFGVDFNPVPNALRINNNVEQNLRITAGGAGIVNTDGTINQAGVLGANIGLAAAAYSDNVPGGTAGNTTLFVIDAQRGLLLTQGSLNFPGGPPAPGTVSTSPNTGTLFTVGSLGLGLNLGNNIGFDIDSNGRVLASFGNVLREINVNTGAASAPLGTVGGIALRDIAISQIPEPSSIALVALGIAGLVGYRLRRRKA